MKTMKKIDAIAENPNLLPAYELVADLTEHVTENPTERLKMYGKIWTLIQTYHSHMDSKLERRIQLLWHDLGWGLFGNAPQTIARQILDIAYADGSTDEA